jgi:hypothetical protein
MKSSIQKLAASAAGVFTSLIALPNAWAAQGDGFFGGTDAAATTITVAKTTSLGANVTSLINYFLGFLGLIAVAFLIYGGVLMVTSGGNEEGVGKAKKLITYAAIGIVIIMLSYSIVTFVTSALG